MLKYRIKMASQTEENYLKALFSLAGSRGNVNISELSKSLNVSKPTANSMVKNLKSKGLVNYEKYKPLSLTQKGKAAATRVIRKHRLTEMFLAKKMNFGWEEVHEIAEQVEHIDSEKFFDRMDEILGHPRIDPHGSPIPDKDGNIQKQAYKPLSQSKPGEKVKITALAYSSTSFLEFLNSRNLQLGTQLEVLAKEPFDESMQVRYKDASTEVLSSTVCEKLLVDELE